MSESSGLEHLETLVRECASSGVGRRALLLRTDTLPPALSRPHHLRLAREALDPLTLADRARTHELPGGRFAVSWRGNGERFLRRTLAGLEALLQDAPLDAPSVPELVGIFALPLEGEALMREARAGTLRAPAPEPIDQFRPALVKAPLPVLDTASLHELETQLAVADMTRFARRRMVCRAGANEMQPAWERRYLSVPELIETVCPGRDPQIDPWLLRRLSRLLDRRMLALLCDPRELRGAGPFGLALNVSSVLSPEFLRFDAGLPPALRDRVVIEFSPADVMSDPAAFAFARNFAHSRQYRIAVGEVTARLLPLLNLPTLQADFISLRWTALPTMPATLPESGGARWLLVDANDATSVQWGRKAGIGLFAGAGVGP